MTKTIDGTTYEVKPSTYVVLDGQQIGRELRCADWLKGVEGWEDVTLAWPDPVFTDQAHAVRVEITGRTIQWDGKSWNGGCPRVRVRVEFVGDGEPSTFVSGWAYTQSMKKSW